MILAFFESVRYVGHLVPVAFLRIYMGYYYFEKASEKMQGDFLSRPRLAEQIAEWLPVSQAPDWARFFFNFLIPHWSTVSFVLLGLEFAVAISYIFGYVVRPVAVMAAFLCFLLLFISPPGNEELLKTFMAFHIMMAWMGAGRCLGFDYYFYKRQRGLWW